MELKFAATARPDKASADVQRRQKLVRRIDQRKRPVEAVVGNGQFRDAGGGTGMTDCRVGSGLAGFSACPRC
ncbi:MAG: hypothetical protein ACK4RT_05690 [Erythrobacter sp.]